MQHHGSVVCEEPSTLEENGLVVTGAEEQGMEMGFLFLLFSF